MYRFVDARIADAIEKSLRLRRSRAGDEDELLGRGWVFLAHEAVECDSVQLRHDDVAQHGVERVRLPTEADQSSMPADGNFSPVRPQGSFQAPRHESIIIHDEYPRDAVGGTSAARSIRRALGGHGSAGS